MIDMVNTFQRKLQIAAAVLADAKELLTDIDNICGDGDLGISMDIASLVLRRTISENRNEKPVTILSRCATAIGQEAPSTMGTLSSIAMMEAARFLEKRENLRAEDIIDLPDIMANAIIYYGRAQRYDKTVLDTLIPFAETLRKAYGECHDLECALREANRVAIQSTVETNGMIARIGRAKWIGERARHCQDGGATACALVINAMVTEDTHTLLHTFENSYCARAIV